MIRLLRFCLKAHSLLIAAVLVTASCQPVTPPNTQDVCLDFEDLALGDSFGVGDSFITSGVTVNVLDFVFLDGTSVSGGFTEIQSGGSAGGSGNELVINNVTLEFNFSPPANGLTLMFGEYGGNLNITINGDFKNFENFTDIDGSTIGGVGVSVPAGGFGNDMGILELTGAVDTLSLGGQELWIDNNCGAVSTTGCIDFSDLALGITYNPGDTFSSAGVTLDARDFVWSSGTSTSGGYAAVENGGLAGGSDNELAINNVNIGFDFGVLIEGLELSFGEYGGNLNIEMNGDFVNFGDITDIDGTTIGGVDVSVAMAASPDGQGILKLVGSIDTFIFGGQELWIDNVCPVYP